MFYSEEILKSLKWTLVLALQMFVSIRRGDWKRLKGLVESYVADGRYDYFNNYIGPEDS